MLGGRNKGLLVSGVVGSSVVDVGASVGVENYELKSCPH